MPQEPEIKSLSYSKRQRFFFILCALFLILLPTMIFYTTGYRINLDDTDNRIVTTGGVYITTDNLDVDVYLNDDQVRRPRLFRSAYYIQDIESGSHRVVVQQDGLHTWVKDLPVDPYIVVEAAAFNMPLTSQVRHVTEFLTVDGAGVVPAVASSSALFKTATTTQTIFFATTTATSSYEQNAEFTFVESLFSTSSATSTTLLQRIIAGVEQFGFATTSNNATSTMIEPPQKGNITLLELAGELQAIWTGPTNSIPYYFCISNTGSSSIASRYGDHVAVQVATQRTSTTTPLYVDENRICRSAIQIDRKRQDVLFYDFLPGSSDLVLLQLEDGIYVTEIDDRAWQNTQQLYAGSEIAVLIENDTIYIEQDGLYAELLTEIPEE